MASEANSATPLVPASKDAGISAADRKKFMEPVAQEGAKPKIMFLCLPMRGHVVPLMRLAEQFLRMGTHEVHASINTQLLSLAPKGTIIASQEQDGGSAAKLGELFDDLFRGLSDRSNWEDSQAGMFSGFAEAADDIVEYRKIGKEAVEKVRPDIIVADHGLSADGHLPNFCMTLLPEMKYFAVNCTGRPENVMRMALGIIGSHLCEALRAVPRLLHMTKRMTSELGPPPCRQTWTTILPAVESLSSSPNANDVFVGPFLPLPKEETVVGKIATDKNGDVISEMKSVKAGNSMVPGKIKTGGKYNAIGQAETMRDGTLLDWIENPENEDPIVYVAFGTIVKIEQETLNRIAFGLARGSWRVLWAIKTEQQKNLPPALQTGGKYADPDRFRLEHFAPQAKILAHANVKCFVTHCGQNSITESLSCGVPMVCMPFFCDQYEWAESVCRDRKAGVQLDKKTVTQGILSKAVTRVLQEPHFRKHASLCAQDLQKFAKRVEREVQAGKLLQNPCVGVPVAAAYIAGIYTQEEVRLFQPIDHEAKSCCGR